MLLHHILTEKVKRGDDQGDLRTGWVLNKAWRQFPMASSDEEALAMWMNDKVESDVQDLEGKVSDVNKNAQNLLKRQQQVIKKQETELDSIEKKLQATTNDNIRQEKNIDDLIVNVNNANLRYDAQEKRFRDLTARVANQQITQADVDAAKVAKELEKADDAQLNKLKTSQIVKNDINEVEYTEARDWDEGNTEPPNNFAVYINGKKWKVFKGRGRFAGDHNQLQHHRQLQNWAQAKSAATGKEWKVYVTGEQATQEGVAKYTIDEQSDLPGTAIPMKSVMQGYTVFYNPRTREISVTRGGDSAEAAIEQARINQPTMLAFRSAVDRMINKIEDDQGVTESALNSEIEKHIMEMRHAGYDIVEGYGSYYCSTKKRMVQRKSPKQKRSS